MSGSEVQVPPNRSEVRGASAVAKGALAGARGAGIAQPALVILALGVIVAPRRKQSVVVTFKVKDGKIVQIEVIADPARLRELDLAVLNNSRAETISHWRGLPPNAPSARSSVSSWRRALA